MITKLVSKTSLQILILIPIGSFFISQVIQKNLDSLDPTKPMHQTSAVAFGQFVFWMVTIFFILFIYSLYLRDVLNLNRTIDSIFIYLHLLIAGILTGTAFVALNGTPFYFGLLGGDLGVHMQMAQDSIDFGWNQRSYPPLWSAIVGWISNILGIEIIDSYKYISIHFISIWIAITFFLFRAVLPNLIAGSLSIIFSFSMGIDGWKSAGQLWTQLICLYFIKFILEIYSEKAPRSISLSIKSTFIGIAVGISTLVYSGRFWWISLAFSVAIFLTNFLKSHRTTIQLLIVDFLFGISLALVPTLKFLLSGYFSIDSQSSLIQIWFILILLYLIWIFIKFPKNLEKIVAQILTLISSAILIQQVFTQTINDPADPDANVYNSVVPDFGFGGIPEISVMVVVIVLGSIALLKQKDVLKFQTLFLLMNVVSALMIMLYFAWKMYLTGNMELYPRAAGTVIDSWRVIIFILIFSILRETLNRFNINANWFKVNQNSLNFAVMFFITVLILSFYVSKELSLLQWEMFPREGNFSLFAWISRHDVLSQVNTGFEVK